jgi:hypothetical protein
MLPAMTAPEIACYVSLLTRARVVVEYGIGGSTLLAIKQGVSRLTSVDSDRAWIEKVEAVQEVQDAKQRGVATFLHADVGPVGQLGSPTDKTFEPVWARYAMAPWRSETQPDLVLIDGRFRIACALQTALSVLPETQIVIHDFWNRPPYHVVLPHLEWIRSVDTMGVFCPRKDIDRVAVARQLFAAFTDPA